MLSAALRVQLVENLQFDSQKNIGNLEVAIRGSIITGIKYYYVYQQLPTLFYMHTTKLNIVVDFDVSTFYFCYDF